MSNILLITHNDIGAALLATAKQTFNTLPCKIKTMGINQTANTDILLTQIKSMIENLDEGQGVLILTDMYGSTPSNLANHFLITHLDSVKIISGLNLPMLIRAINYTDLPLANLAEKAFLGGRDGVCICTCKPDQRIKTSYDSTVCYHHQ